MPDPYDSEALRGKILERMSLDEIADLYVDLARSKDARTALRGAELLARALGMGTKRTKGSPSEQSSGVRLNLRSVLSGGRAPESVTPPDEAPRRRRRQA